MESLISDLRRRQQQQYAASSAVSQAMLLHALNQTTRQVASRLSASLEIPSGPQAGNHLLSNQQVERVPSPSVNNNQCAPLDLSVKSQTTNQRSRPQNKQQRPSSLFNETNSHVNTQHSDIGQLNQSKLITSSTSPTSSGSTDSQSATSSEPTCFLRDSNNNQIDDQVPTAAAHHHQLAHELISSTNCRRQRTRRYQGVEGAKRGHKGAAGGHLCNFCGRSFSRSDMLTRHSRLHSGLKPYQCGKCYQVFSRSDHLSTHERTHTGEKPYQCQYCDYSACRRDMITRHMRTHSASQDGELETRVNSRRRRRRRLFRKATGEATKDSINSDKINEHDDEDVSTSFEISVT